MESIRSFEIESQTSNNTFESIEILADLENKESSYSRDHIFNFLNKESVIISENLTFLKDELKDLNTYLTDIKSTQNEFNPKQINELFYNGDSLLFDLEKF